MSVLSDLSTTVLDFVKNSIKLKSLNKEDILSIIEENLKVHQNVISSTNSLTNVNIQKAMEKYESNKGNSKLPSNDIFNDLYKLYNRPVKDLIMKTHALAPIIDVNKKFVKILQQAQKNIDKLIIDDELTIFSTRISHVALLGLLKQSELYGTYSSFLLSQFIKIAADDRSLTPGYRVQYLVSNLSDFAKVTNLVSEKVGRYSFLGEVENMKKKNINMLLYANGKTFDFFTRSSDFNITTLSYLKHGVNALNIFGWIGGIFIDIQHQRYLKNKQTKEWMENSVALLKMSLDETDPNDPKYRNQMDIIEAYSTEISKLDKKINEYLEE